MIETPSGELQEPVASSVSPTYWEAAQAGAARLGARIDWPVASGKGFKAQVAWSTGNPPEHHELVGRGATGDAALLDLISKFPPSGTVSPAAHCPTCSCSPEVLANGQ